MLDESQIIRSTIHLREHLDLDLNGFIPDIEELIHVAGYHFIEADFYDDFSGFTQYLGKLDYLIGFNKSHDWTPEFKRFTLAHELGHLSIPNHLEVLHKESRLVSTPGYYSDKEIEQEANIFAINFLAPSNPFKAKLNKLSISYSALEELRSYYKISREATAIRMMKLTNEDCSFIVSNTNNKILYDQRSGFFYDNHWHNSIRGNQVNDQSQAYSYSSTDGCVSSQSRLKNWYPSIRDDYAIKEQTFDLGYQNRIGTFITVDSN